MKTYKGFNNTGDPLEATQYKGKTWIVFFPNTGSCRKANIDNVRAGKVKDLYKPSKYGVGYNGNILKRYPWWKKAKDLWSNMLKRCYFEKDARGYYGRAVVAPEWHCFATFLEDIKDLPNFDKWLLNSDPYDLDKDYRVGALGVYSKQNCMFLPRSLNRSEGKKGKHLVDGAWVANKP